MNPAGWEQTPNTILAAASAGRVSIRALGVFILLRQRQGVGAAMSSDALAADGVEGRDAIRAAFRELAAAGYLHHVTVTDSAGRRRTVTRLYDEPTAAESPAPENPAPAGIPAPGKPASGKPGPLKAHTNYTYPPTPSAPAPGSPAPGNPSPVDGRHVFTPDDGGLVCLQCQLPAANVRHFPGLAAAPLPVTVAPRRRGGPTRGRGNAWSANTRRRKAS